MVVYTNYLDSVEILVFSTISQQWRNCYHQHHFNEILRPTSIRYPWHNNSGQNGRYQIYAVIIQNAIPTDVSDIFTGFFDNSSGFILTWQMAKDKEIFSE